FALRDEIVINEIMYHAPPTLEVPATIGSNAFVSLTNLWRYDQTGTDLGTAWRDNNYNDSAWAVGSGAFYFTTANIGAPRNTELMLGPTTYYFRASFVYGGAQAAVALNLRYLVDDGTVVYLNGREISRFNLPNGLISYTNNAMVSILNAGLRAPVP